MPRWRLVTRRVAAWLQLAVGFVIIYAQCWFAAFRLEPVFRGRRPMTSEDVLAPMYPLVELWLWAKGFQSATDDRVPAGLAYAVALAVLIGLVIYTLSWPSPFPVVVAAVWLWAGSKLLGRPGDVAAMS